MRQDQQKIAEDLERRLRIQAQGDTYQPPKPASPSEKGLAIPQRKRQRRISSQGLVSGFRKNNSPV